jgi:hypothetical protein
MSRYQPGIIILFATATRNTIGGHLGKGKNEEVGIKTENSLYYYFTLRLFYFARHCLKRATSVRATRNLRVLKTFAINLPKFRVIIFKNMISLISLLGNEGAPVVFRATDREKAVSHSFYPIVKFSDTCFLR